MLIRFILIWINLSKVEIYNRSIFIFSVCIMVRKDQYLSRKFWYQETVRKLALFFTALEVKQQVVHSASLLLSLFFIYLFYPSYSFYLFLLLRLRLITSIKTWRMWSLRKSLTSINHWTKKKNALWSTTKTSISSWSTSNP